MTPGHYVCVNIDWIDRIAHRNLDVAREQLLEVAAVAFRSVRDEYFVRRDVDAARLEVVLGYLVAQERIALFRTIAVEVVPPRLVVDGLVHRRHDRRCERLGDVADSEADYFRSWICGGVCGDSVRDLREEVCRLYLQVVLVCV